MSKTKTLYSYENKPFEERPYLQYALPWAIIISPDSGIVQNKNADLMAGFKFRGPDTASSTPEELIAYNNQLNNVFKLLPTGVVLYLDAHRHLSGNYEKSQMPSAFLQKIEDDREEYYNNSSHYDTDYYFIVCYRMPGKARGKITDFFIEDAKGKNKKAISSNQKFMQDQLNKFVEILNNIAGMLDKQFQSLEALKTEEMLAYLHSTISTKRHPITYNPTKYVSDYLVDCGFTTGRSPKLGDKHMRIITILNFKPMSYPGVLDVFNQLPIEYRWTSRFICLSKYDAQKELKNHQSRWKQLLKTPWQMLIEAINHTTTDNVNEDALIKENDISYALMKLGEDALSFGYYTMTMTLLNEDLNTLTEQTNLVVEQLNSLGFTAYVETENSAAAWFGSLPGCYKNNCRRPIISSLNFSHLAPTTAAWAGDKRNDYLNGAVILYTDTSGATPFRLNFHVGDLGHTMVVGPSGAGKSVLLNTLEAHFMKYKDANVFIFDKSMSSRAITLAVGGNFYDLANEEHSNGLSFQPFANIDDSTEIKWAKEWIISYLKGRNVNITPATDSAIWKALNSLKIMSKEERTISNFSSMVQDNDIRMSLEPLTMNGAYGRLFDNNKDFAGEGHWQVFEMETLMNTKEIVPITLEYLFHRIETQIKTAKGPSIIVLDECWLFFDNPIFKDKLREYFKDMRKKNTSIIFATQNLTDIANKTDLMTTVMENCPSRIFLPNINAINEQNKEMYKQFGCNETQINIIATMTPKRDYYYSSSKGNRIFRLALQPMEAVFVTSTAKTDQQAIDLILQDHSNTEEFIKEWLTYKGQHDLWKNFEMRYLNYEKIA